MRRVKLGQAAIKRAAVRATRQSASLENRIVPNTFVRSEKVERFVAQRANKGDSERGG